MSLEYKYAQIVTYPVPKCYNDYLCLQNINGVVTEVNMSKLTLFSNNSAKNLCIPLTNSNICSFTYTNQYGEIVTEKPGTYVNTWSTDFGCSSDNNYEGCPLYKIGDIYWRACYNGVTGSKYNDLNRTYFNENQNLAICN